MFGLFSLSLSALIARWLTLLIAITVHEFAHAKTADSFGDNTPRANGRVTLNPIAHLDPLGTVLMLMGVFGWGRPVPVNPYALNRNSPMALMLVSLAGPLSNFLMAVFAAIPLRMGWANDIAPQPFLPSPEGFLDTFIWINLLLCFFNLIPLAPLDGDKIGDYFFPPSVGRVLETIRPYGPMILILLLFVLPRFGFDFIGEFVVPPVLNIYFMLLPF